MNLRKLKRALPKGAEAQRQGDQVEVHLRGATFRVEAGLGWEERQLADYLGSKIPVAVALPPREQR